MKVFYVVCVLILNIFVINEAVQNKLNVTSSWFIDEIFEHYADNMTQYLTLEGLEKIMSELNEKSDDHDHGHDSHAGHSHQHRTLRVKARHGIESNCLDIRNLANIYKLNNESLINKQNFTEISSSLVWVSLLNDCHDHEHNSTDTNACTYSIGQKYLFGSLTMFAIWLSSLSSVIIISRFKKGKKNIILFLNSLAIGTLLADAFIHVIPQALGIHVHADDSDDHDHDHEHSDQIPTNIPWKMTAILGTMFVLMLMDCFGQGGHEHSHGHFDDSDDDEKNNDIRLDKINSNKPNKLSSVVPEAENPNFKTKSKKFIKLFRGTGLIVFLANLVHKCADGLVIGAAFGASPNLGFSTALAIFFHEVPHELGDYGLLQTTGFSNCQIISMNSIGSFTAFCGFLIIVAISPSPSVRQWIFTITAGLFIYVSLAGMIPRIKLVFVKKEGKRNWLSVLLFISGFLLGTALMIVIAIFEHDLSINVSALCRT